METKKQNNTFTGVITTARRGIGFINHPDFEESVRIEGEDLNTALNGDTVEICLHPSKKNSEPKAEVTKIVQRARTRFVGIIQEEEGLYYLVPDNSRMYTNILIAHPEQKITPGHKAVVELTTWTDPAKDPLGKIIKILGPKGNHEVEIKSIEIEYNIDTNFPKEVEQGTDVIQKEWHTNGGAYIEESVAKGDRRDFRTTTTFTIDPADAKDFDDAISLKELHDGMAREDTARRPSEHRRATLGST